MCLTQAATVVALAEHELLVDIDGRRQVLTNLLVPEARVGDDVLVGMGSVLAALSPAEASALRALHASIETPAAGAPAAIPDPSAAASPRRPAVHRV